MTTQTNTVNTNSQLYSQRDTSKIFLWNNRYETGTYTNSGYDDVTLAAGTVMGRVTTTGKLTPLESDATDGSQIPVGILHQDYTVAAGEDQTISICTAGDVASGKLVFAKTGDTLDTVVSGRRLRDRIPGDTLGINLVASTELTKEDND